MKTIILNTSNMPYDYFTDHNEVLNQQRNKSIQFFISLLLLIFLSRYVAIHFYSEEFTKAKSDFSKEGLSYRGFDYVIYYMMIPWLYFGWCTISKLFRSITNYSIIGGNIVTLLFMLIIKFIAAFFLGCIIVPLLIMINLIRLFQPRLISKFSFIK